LNLTRVLLATTDYFPPSPTVNQLENTNELTQTLDATSSENLGRGKNAASVSTMTVEYLQPLYHIRDHVVSLYFTHVHAIFPILDEYHFTTTYDRYRDTEDMGQHIPNILLQAVMFAGLAVPDSTKTMFH